MASLRESQDAEYQQSLLADRQKEIDKITVQNQQIVDIVNAYIKSLDDALIQTNEERALHQKLKAVEDLNELSPRSRRKLMMRRPIIVDSSDEDDAPILHDDEPPPPFLNIATMDEVDAIPIERQYTHQIGDGMLLFDIDQLRKDGHLEYLESTGSFAYATLPINLGSSKRTIFTILDKSELSQLRSQISELNRERELIKDRANERVQENRKSRLIETIINKLREFGLDPEHEEIVTGLYEIVSCKMRDGLSDERIIEIVCSDLI